MHLLNLLYGRVLQFRHVELVVRGGGSGVSSGSGSGSRRMSVGYTLTAERCGDWSALTVGLPPAVPTSPVSGLCSLKPMVGGGGPIDYKAQ